MSQPVFSWIVKTSRGAAPEQLRRKASMVARDDTGTWAYSLFFFACKALNLLLSHKKVGISQKKTAFFGNKNGTFLYFITNNPSFLSQHGCLGNLGPEAKSRNSSN